MEQNLNLYYIFYVTAQCGNITKASQALFISQPAVSKAIKKLEENLGTPLFRRTSRGVSLTEDGQLLYRHVEDAFSSLNAGEDFLARRRRLGISRLRIGASTTLCKYILLPCLQSFIQEHPHVRVTISCQSTYQTLSLLEERKIDLGLIGEPQSLGTGYVFLPVQSITDTFVSTRSYLKNLKIRENNTDLLQTAAFMLLDEENITRQFINTLLQEQQISLRNVLEVSTMDLLIEFARIGLGIACVIREFVHEDLQKGRLCEVPLGIRFNPRQIGIVYRREDEEYTAIKEFLRGIKAR